jgi:RsmE family RNA methyltransferase
VNLLLFDAGERDSQGRVRITGDRLAWLRDVVGAEAGSRIAVGEIGGSRGAGTVIDIDDEHALLAVSLGEPPPARAPLVLVLALPRPKMLRRMLRATAEFGIEKLILLNSERVEKSFWQSALLAPPSLRGYLLAGAAQARDTQLPLVELRRRFRPFAEDELPALCRGREALIAHPGPFRCCPGELRRPSLLMLGPEAGFSDFELRLARAAGCDPVSLGPRTLRAETALIAALGRLLPPCRGLS